MAELNRSKAMLFLLLAIALIALSSCEKTECSTSGDCAPKICHIQKCADKKCAYTAQSNCCGNGIKDALENGKPGNQCTCPQDYGKCDGKGKVKTGSRTEDAVYVHYYCNEHDQCAFGVDAKDINKQNILDTIDIGFFKASSVVRYNKPFDSVKDTFEFKVTLDDINKDIVLPVTFTKLKLLYNSQNARVEQLIAEKSIDNSLASVGSESTITTSLNLNYLPKELEESGSFRYSIDYIYTKRTVSGKAKDGSKIYSDEQVRETFTSSSKPVFLVRSG